ncbi:hypothetical protein [Flaviflexus massiliensis]|uniref:hypothetical protein n=1 Tax=Flaviflexus massiliensis TaxID=1522309 RepID=UPI0006D5ABAB|nr:hypothetical protein [Flaviflexus massiliensis]
MSSTNVVANITGAGFVPADRPQDRIQRIFSGLFIGTLVGSIIVILFFAPNLTIAGLIVPFIVSFAIAAVGYLLWRSVRGKAEDTSVPVVAKVLGTDESVLERTTRSRGILVPVIVRPLEGADFRSVVISVSDSKEPPRDIAPGTIMALRQVEPGLGELISAPANDEQRELMERWAKNPKLVSNRAPALPNRRAPLERSPFLSGLEFYASIGVGAAIMFFILQVV